MLVVVFVAFANIVLMLNDHPQFTDPPRLDNLKRLMAAYKKNGVNNSAFAVLLTGISASYLSQLKGGYRPITEHTARQIESNLGLYQLFLDQPDLQENDFKTAAASPGQLVQGVSDVKTAYKVKPLLDDAALEFAISVLNLAMDDPDFDTVCSAEWQVLVFKKMYNYRLALNESPLVSDIKPLLHLIM